MGNRIRRQEAVSDGLRRIAAERLQRVASRADDPDRDPDRTIHEVRTTCKRVRGLLRLARPAMKPKHYAREDARFRDLAGAARASRDAKVMLDLLDELAVRVELSDASRRKLRRTLRDELDEGAPATNSREVLDGLRPRIAEAYEALPSWSWKADGFASIEDGYRDTYRRARRTLGELRESANSERLHAWRKQVKFGLYQTEALLGVWPAAQAARRAALAELGRRLGDEHDHAELRGHLRELSGVRLPVRLLEQLEARRVRLRGKCLRAGERLFADPPRAHVDHLRRLWVLWRGHDEA